MQDRTVVGPEVLEVYLKENPSTITIEEEHEYLKFKSGQRRLWHSLLKLPPRAFRDAEVLDYGCGTGEIDVLLAQNGAFVKGVDFNPESIDRARKLAEKFALQNRLNFLVGDIHESIFEPTSADFAISLGVLPHVAKPEVVFQNMVQTLRPEAFLVLGFVEELGIVQRLLHRSIVRAIAGIDEDKIMAIARQAFPDHINRSVRFGQRSERSVVYDYLINRHMYGLPLEKVLGWFDSHGISLYSSWPSIDLPFRINPYTSKSLALMNPAWKEYRALLRLRMLFTQFEDDDVFSSLLSEKGFDAGHSIRCHVNDLSELMTGLVQNQSQLWPDQDLQQLPELTVSLKCTADMVMNKLWRNLMDDLKQACNALEQVVSDIGKLQRNEISEFRPAANLFRELNGLGTFYLVGVLER